MRKLIIVSEKMKKEGGLDAGSLRFALLHHNLPPESSLASHWDLLFEQDHTDLLLTFQLFQLPLNTADHPPTMIPARRITDHRPLYLNYEGPISHGRGLVTGVARGVYNKSNASPGTERYQLESPVLHAILLISEPDVGENLDIRTENWSFSQLGE